jgi:hypothetical protein
MSEEARRRVVALVGAVALVLVAVVVRDRLVGDEGGSGGDGTVVCPTELADVCEQAAGDLDVRVEDAIETADSLVAARRADEVDVDMWLVPRPWAEAVVDARARANAEPLLGDPVGPIARSPVSLVVWDEREAALEGGSCNGALTWRCVGDAADRPWDEVGGRPHWGEVRAGLADPGSATGLMVLGGATAGYFERSDYASNDFDGGLSSWLGGWASSSDEAAGDDPVSRMLTRGPGELAVLGALEADALPATDRDDVQVLVPEPFATADLVVVPVGDSDGPADDVADDGDLLDALAQAGWRVPDHPLASGLDPDLTLTDDDGLPGGAVLRALLDRWLELT